ncbi:MAG: flagellar basal body-associated FliL family protein [Eubacteriaceae bacterium]
MSPEETKQKKSKFKLIVIILIVLVLLLSTVIGYFAITGKSIATVLSSFEKHEEFYIVLDDFVVNINGINDKSNYLKTQVSLSYTNKKYEDIISSNTSKIRDVIITSLREKSTVELLNCDNIEQIKQEIVQNVNEILNQEVVENLYFTDFLIQ